MAKNRPFHLDDQNDTLLFAKLQEYVLEHYPNPERIGCPDPEVLRRFIDAPNAVDLDDLNNLHIFRCAECTRELSALRMQRQRPNATSELLPAATARNDSNSRRWLRAIAAVILCALAIGGYEWRKSPTLGTGTRIVAAQIDLSNDGPSRGAAPSVSGPHRLPRSLMKLQLVLPVYSPPGKYDVSIAKDRGSSTAFVHGPGTAYAQGPRTVLTVQLDLRRLDPGSYYLSTQLAGDPAPSLYPVNIE